MVHVRDVVNSLEASLAKFKDEQKVRIKESQDGRNQADCVIFGYTGGYNPDQGNCQDSFELGVQYGEELGRIDTLERVIKSIKEMKE
jgi:hypothetical protein